MCGFCTFLSFCCEPKMLSKYKVIFFKKNQNAAMYNEILESLTSGAGIVVRHQEVALSDPCEVVKLRIAEFLSCRKKRVGLWWKESRGPVVFTAGRNFSPCPPSPPGDVCFHKTPLRVGITGRLQPRVTGATAPLTHTGGRGRRPTAREAPGGCCGNASASGAGVHGTQGGVLSALSWCVLLLEYYF